MFTCAFRWVKCEKFVQKLDLKKKNQELNSQLSLMQVIHARKSAAVSNGRFVQEQLTLHKEIEAGKQRIMDLCGQARKECNTLVVVDTNCLMAPEDRSEVWFLMQTQP